MNISVTSKEDILRTSRNLVREKGWSALNIRTLASECNVSVGSIYNYFDSKSELVVSTVESIWYEIFHGLEDEQNMENLESCILWIYGRLEYGNRKYPDFFSIHSLSFMDNEKGEGRRRMARAWGHIKGSFRSALDRDESIRRDAFDADFTKDGLVEFIFSFLLSSMLRKNYDSSVLIKMLKRTLY